MVDYRDIGTRIRQVRLQKKMTQEQLANAVDVGTAHISHIETGNTIPSLQTFIAILNALDCSADELLCKELDRTQPIARNWLAEQVVDCTPEEIKIISDTVVALKTTLKRNRREE